MRRKILYVLGFLLVLLLTAFLWIFGPNLYFRLTEDGISMAGPALSPDGRTILVAFERPGELFKIAEYEISSGKFTILNLAPNYHWFGPSYASDGKHIAALYQCVFICTNGEGPAHHVAVIERRTLAVNTLTDGEKFRYSPVFSPDMRRMYYTENKAWRGLDEGHVRPFAFPYLVRRNLETGFEEVLFSDDDGAGALSISSASFVNQSDDEILFSMSHPHKKSQFFQYDNQPEKIIDMIGVKRDRDGNLSLLPENYETHDLSLSASPVTGEFVFVSDSNIKVLPGTRSYQYDLFIAGKQGVVQLTDHRTTMVWPDISYDGSRIAFAADKSRRNQWEVWYYDRALGKAFKTGIRDMIKKLPPNKPS